MADEVERIRIEIDDSDAKSKQASINKGMDDLETKAGSVSEGITQATEQAQAQILRVTQTSQQSINRTLASFRQKVQFEGVTDPVQKATLEYQKILSRVSGDTKAVEEITRLHQQRLTQIQASEAKKRSEIALEEAKARQLALDKEFRDLLVQAEREKAIAASQASSRQNILFSAQRRGVTGAAGVNLDRSKAISDLLGAGGSAQEVKALNQEFDRLVQNSEQGGNRFATAIVRYFQSPAYGAATAVDSLSSKFGNFVALAGTVAAAAIGVKLGFDFISSAAEKARQTVNLAERIGATNEQAYRLGAIAKVTGVEVGGFETAIRRLSQAIVDGGEEGKRGAEALAKIGVSAYDSQGALKSTFQIYTDIAHAVSGLNTAQRTAALSNILGRGAVELFPAFTEFDKINAQLDALGIKLDSDLIARLSGVNSKLAELGLLWDIAKEKAAGFFIDGLSRSSQYLTVLNSIIALGADKLFGKAPIPTPALVPPTSPEQLAAQRARTHGNLERDALLARADSATALAEKLKSAEVELGNLETKFRATDFATKAAADTAFAAVTNQRNLVESLKEQIKLQGEIDSKRQAALEFATKASAVEIESLDKVLLVNRSIDAEGKLITNGAVDQYYSRVNAALRDYNLEIEKQGKLNDVVARSNIYAGFVRTLHAALNDLRADTVKGLAELLPEAEKIEAEILKSAQAFDAETRNIQRQGVDEQLNYQLTRLDQARDAQLRIVENTDAKTLEAKVAFELKKGQIEAAYAAQRAQIEILQARSAGDLEIQRLQDQLNQGLITDEQFQSRRLALSANEAAREGEIRLNADAAVNKAREDAAIKSAEAIRDANTKVFDTFKRESEGIFDAMLAHGQNIFQALGSALKNALLTVAKDVLSNQVARSLTSIFTGQQVGLTPAGPTPSGVFGQIQRALGIGSKPTFGTPGITQSKLEQANHLGDVLLQPTASGGAVPVYVANASDLTSQQQINKQTSISQSFNLSSTGTGSLGSARAPLAAGLGLILGLGAAAPAVAAASGGGGGAFGSPTTPGIVTSTLNGESTGPGQIFGLSPGADISAGSPSGFLGGVASPFSTSGLAIPGLNYSGGGFESNPFGSSPASPGSPFDLPLGQGNSELSGALGQIFTRPNAIGGNGLTGGLSGILGKIGGFNSGTIYLQQGVGTTAAGIGGIGGTLAGLGTSNIATGLGLGLLTSGLANPLTQNPASAIAKTGLGGALAGFSIGSKIPGVGGVYGAEIGAGIGLLVNGVQRGGTVGRLESVGGGALAGFGIAGPIGAVVGAAVGFGLSFIQTKAQKVRDRVKSAFGVDIRDNGVLQQLVNIVNQNYGGNVAAGILSPEARNLIELYAETTGQNALGIVAHAQQSIFSNVGGKLTELPTYFNGQAVLPGQTQSTQGLPAITPHGGSLGAGYTQLPVVQGANVPHVTIQLDPGTTSAFVQGQQITAIQGNPRAVSSAAANGSDTGAGQRDLASSLLNPSFITS